MTGLDKANILSFEERFPVLEERCHSDFSNEILADLNVSAAEVLTANISLEQMSYEHVDNEAKGFSSEIHRLEQKIDFITELLAKALQSRQQELEKINIEMSAEEICWQSKLTLKEGEFCLLSLHLSQKYPSPLQLPIEVISTLKNNETHTQIIGRIRLTDDAVIDDLTRMVFLFHRRQIARKRG